MITLFVLADDLTGALDTAIQFVEQGVSTRVVIDEAYDFIAIKLIEIKNGSN